MKSCLFLINATPDNRLCTKTEASKIDDFLDKSLFRNLVRQNLIDREEDERPKDDAEISAIRQSYFDSKLIRLGDI
jgi:hypothetical protein